MIKKKSQKFVFTCFSIDSISEMDQTDLNNGQFKTQYMII